MAGISLREAVTERRGLRYDRRWMVVTPDGNFVSQREIPGLALVGTALTETELVLFDRNRPEDRFAVSLQPVAGDYLEVNVWGDECRAQAVDGPASAWLSARFGRELLLVYMPDDSIRPADSRYAPEGQFVSFADGYPFLIIGAASLADLNGRLAQSVPMNRFRPNFVFEGGAPFEEDDWKNFHIGNQSFTGVKRCARCIMTTIDQDKPGLAAEPLKTLSTYRFQNNKVLFGQNLIWTGNEQEAKVIVGDIIRLVAVDTD